MSAAPAPKGDGVEPAGSRSERDDGVSTARADPVDPAPQGTDDAARRRPLLTFAVVGLFALLYAYDLFEAISNVVGVVTQVDAYNVFAAENGLNEASVPWALLVVNLALPAVLFAVALLLGRGRGLGMRALLLTGGLAVVATLTLTLTALA